MNFGELQKSLPKCPTCGNTPEFALKPHQLGWVFGGLKCPYNHHRVQLNGPAENKNKAMEVLAPMWIEMVQKTQEGKKA
ncbi:MAG: hypothetical protein RR308_01070 [Hafnia sp.]